MNELETKIYEHFKTENRYMYSSDSSAKYLEQNAIDNLELNGYISVKMRTIGYAIAEIC